MTNMTRPLILQIAILSAAACGAALAGTNRAAENQLFGRSDTSATSSPAAVKQPVNPYLLDELDVPAGLSVADFLKQIQSKTPLFQYVAEPGPWKDDKLPAVTLRNISVDQIPLLLTNLDPTISVRNIKSPYGDANTIYVFGKSAGPFTPPPIGTGLSAFGLADPAERIGLRNAWANVDKEHDAPTPEQISAGRKKGLQEVLSLLEAAASQANADVPATLKLHEETEVLLVRGTAAQLKAISEALTSLQSVESLNQYRRNYVHLSDAYGYTKERTKDLQLEVKNLLSSNDTLAREVNELKSENASLKQQLKAATPAAGEGKH